MKFPEPMDPNYSPNNVETWKTFFSPKAIFVFILALYLLRLFLIWKIPLVPDEAYYWYWSVHPDWSYFDHPPMIAYLMALSTRMGGYKEVFVRLSGYISTMVTLVFIFGTARILFNNTVKDQAWETIFLLNITLLFSAGCIIQTPDTPMLLFWSMATFAGARIVAEKSTASWYLLGVALGLGLLSKYTMILFVPCFYGFILFSHHNRFWLLKKPPYLALVIALLLFSPVIYWNWNHEWISFAYQLKQGFSAHDKSIFNKLAEYLGGQAGVITPLLFMAFIFYSIRSLRAVAPADRHAYLYLGFLSWPILLFFAASSMKGKVSEANWPAPAYIAGFILMWHVYANHFRQNKIHRRFMQSGIVLAAVLTLMVHIHLVNPFIPLPVSLDTTRQFHGWPALGNKIGTVIYEHPSRKGYFLLSDKGTTVAEAVFYTGNQYIGFDYTSPKRYTFLQNTGSLKGQDAIIILHKTDKATMDLLSSQFHGILPMGQHAPLYRGEKIT
ncbi:MAG: glycosyltransferase family 39 protein, partial [Syntrophales bacterium]